MHEGIILRFAGRSHRIALTELTGRAITVYAQHEVIKDLVKVRLDAGGKILFEVKNAALYDLDSSAPKVRFHREGKVHEIEAQFVAGCDGFHGVSRPSIPSRHRQEFARSYPFGWFGILVEGAAVHRGADLCAPRARLRARQRMLATVQRLYFQCDLGRPEGLARRAHLGRTATPRERRGWKLDEGRIFQRGIIAMRSFVVEPMRGGFPHGDAAQSFRRPARRPESGGQRRPRPFIGVGPVLQVEKMSRR